MKQHSSEGFFLIEVVVAASIIATVLIFLLGAIQDSVDASRTSLERTQASYLLEEGAEAVKAIRDGGWSTISALDNATPYALSWSGSAWSLTTSSPETIDAFTRTVTFDAVSRDSSDTIVASGGTLDAGTRKVTITVSWNAAGGSTSVILPFYIANIR
ncbi:MAG TPA: hypothetical protein VG621_00960 [Candidatus Paceibacterota bacterium]|nr:hypothetical protein [Candidatus Paceibacterota bacterium]